MRPIKFRAYDKKQKRWLTDLDNWFTFDDTGSLYLYNGDDTNGGVDPVLMQFTGLRDKHEVDIYEGDLLRYPFDYAFTPEGGTQSHTIGSVVFEEGSFYLTQEEQAERLLCTSNELSEVIGNMWDNPELLGGVKEDE